MRIADHIRRLEEYVPGEQPKAKDVVKLNTNENAYPPSPTCAEVLKAFDLDKLRRYSDPNCTLLRQALADLNGTTIGKIFVGNGSDEILSIAAKTFVENDETIGSLNPSYSLYKTLAAIRDVKWGAYNPFSPSAADSSVPALFLLTNPNAPTGEFREPEEIAAFAKSFPGVVIVDEAYADFARGNCMALATAEGNENLIVMRTFSKSYSLAGLRVGYCVGPEDLIRAMYKVKDSYNVDAIAQAVALAATADQAWMKGNARKIIRTREESAAELRRRGWDVIPSESNFLFARPPAGSSAAEIFERLRAKNIFVRYFPGPLTGDRLRITVGTDEQMAELFRNL